MIFYKNKILIDAQTFRFNCRFQVLKNILSIEESTTLFNIEINKIK